MQVLVKHPIEPNMTGFLSKLLICLLPAALTPLWGYLIAEGYLNFGGGEKDLFLLIPWILWSVIYSLIFIVAWIRRNNIKAILLYSVGGATGILAVAWSVLFIWSNEILGVYKKNLP